MSNFAIRPARPEDATEIADIWLDGLEASSGLPGPDRAVAISAFSNRILHPQNKSGIWVAERDGAILGWQSLSDMGVTQICRVSQSSTYIAKHWHAKGVGRALLCFAQEQALQRSFDIIVGWVKTDNVSSIKLVQSLGWAYVGILPRARDSDPQFAYYAYAVPKPPELSVTEAMEVTASSMQLR